MGNNNMSFVRQLNLVNSSEFKGKSISIIGTGSIGSNLAISLCKIGFGQEGCGTLKLFDFDEVAKHNLANQYYFPNQIGKKKVSALKDNLAVFGCDQVEAHDIKIDTDECDLQELIPMVNASIIIIAVDDNDSRKNIMEDIAPYCKNCEVVIESGMSLTGVRMNYLPNYNWEKTLEKWLKRWKPSAEQKVSACGTSETAYPTVVEISLMITKAIICHYNKFWTKEPNEEIGDPLSMVNIECYQFKGFFKRLNSESAQKIG